jgi:hypothetical protein
MYLFYKSERRRRRRRKGRSARKKGERERDSKREIREMEWVYR